MAQEEQDAGQLEECQWLRWRHGAAQPYNESISNLRPGGARQPLAASWEKDRKQYSSNE